MTIGRLYSDGGVFAFSRSFQGATFVTVLNVAEEGRTVGLTIDTPRPRSIEVMSGSCETLDNGSLQIGIGARTGVVLSIHGA